MGVRGFLLGGAVVAAFALAACGNGTGSGTSIEPASPAAPLAPRSLERSHLYVANATTSQISVYAPGGTSPVRTIADGIVRPTSMLFDAQGNLYVGNGIASAAGGVIVYAPHATTMLRHLRPHDSIVALAMDAAGNLYAGRYRGGVEVYAPGADSPSRTITTGVRIIGALAVDSKGNLYVLNALQLPSQKGTEINVFAPGGSTPIREYKFTPTEQPLSMAFDGADDLYVGIESSKAFTTGQVDYFDAGDPELHRRYVELGVPAAVTLDATEHLYVADWRRDDVYVYTPNQRTLARRLTDDLDGPVSIALDEAGDVYVGNSIGNSVTVYKAGTKTLVRTITEGIGNPVSLVFGP